MKNLEMDYLDIIKDAYKSRLDSNPSYSLRAFARDLEISPAHLSEILNMKVGISEKMSVHIAKKLKLNTKESKIFTSLINRKFAKSSKKKQEARAYIKELGSNKNYEFLSLDGFKLISDWYYFAILTFMELDSYDGTIEWISYKSGLKCELIEDAIKRLQRLDLVIEQNGKYYYSKTNIETTQDVESYALKKSHKQSIEQAVSLIDEVPISLRDITSITMAIDINKLSEAKKRIRKFRHDMAEFLESGEKNEVYNLNLQLVPVKVRRKK